MYFALTAFWPALCLQVSAQTDTHKSLSPRNRTACAPGLIKRAGDCPTAATNWAFNSLFTSFLLSRHISIVSDLGWHSPTWLQGKYRTTTTPTYGVLCVTICVTKLEHPNVRLPPKFSLLQFWGSSSLKTSWQDMETSHNSFEHMAKELQLAWCHWVFWEATSL